MKNMRKKSVAVLLGLAVTGLVGASAASLGGVTSDNLGADVGVVASCDTDGVNVAFATAYSSGVTEVTSVTVSDIAPECDGQALSLTLAQGTTSLATGTVGVIDDTTEVVTVSAGANAELVNRVAISISGPVPAP